MFQVDQFNTWVHTQQGADTATWLLKVMFGYAPIVLATTVLAIRQGYRRWRHGPHSELLRKLEATRKIAQVSEKSYLSDRRAGDSKDTAERAAERAFEKASEELKRILAGGSPIIQDVLVGLEGAHRRSGEVVAGDKARTAESFALHEHIGFITRIVREAIEGQKPQPAAAAPVAKIVSTPAEITSDSTPSDPGEVK